MLRLLNPVSLPPTLQQNPQNGQHQPGHASQGGILQYIGRDTLRRGAGGRAQAGHFFHTGGALLHDEIGVLLQRIIAQGAELRQLRLGLLQVTLQLGEFLLQAALFAL